MNQSFPWPRNLGLLVWAIGSLYVFQFVFSFFSGASKDIALTYGYHAFYLPIVFWLVRLGLFHVKVFNDMKIVLGFGKVLLFVYWAVMLLWGWIIIH